MSQRLIRKSTTPVIGFMKGVPVYRAFGAQPDDGDTTSGDEGSTGDSGEGGTDGEGTDSNDGSGTDANGGTVSKEEYERALARMKAADKNAADALKKVKEYEDKDKSETERLSSEVEDLKKVNEGLADENKRLKFDNAFALQSKHSWQDPEIVLGIVRNHEAVSIDDDGTVSGMEKALDAIAKAKPFLLKTEEGGGDSGPTGPSGSSTGSSKKNDPSKMDEDALRKKYPALNV
jgi:hypothetical protein